MGGVCRLVVAMGGVCRLVVAMGGVCGRELGDGRRM